MNKFKVVMRPKHAREEMEVELVTYAESVEDLMDSPEVEEAEDILLDKIEMYLLDEKFEEFGDSIFEIECEITDITNYSYDADEEEIE